MGHVVWKSFPISKGFTSTTSVDKLKHLHIATNLDYIFNPEHELDQAFTHILFYVHYIQSVLD